MDKKEKDREAGCARMRGATERCNAKKRTGSAREWEMKAMGEEKERKEEKLAADRIDWK